MSPARSLLSPRTVVDALLESARVAPSGDNSQPWRFVRRTSGFSIVLDGARIQKSYLSFGNVAPLIAVGAMLENVERHADKMGVRLAVRVFCESVDVTVLGAGRVVAPDVEIARRRTERVPYARGPLLVEERRRLREASGATTLRLVESEPARREVARALAEADAQLFSISGHHASLHAALREGPSPDGIPTASLALPSWMRFALRLTRRFAVAKTMGYLGAGHIAKQAMARRYAAASALGVLSVTETSPEALVALGRSFQRVWLTVTELGLRLQPLTALLFLSHRMRCVGERDVPARSARAIRAASSRLRETLGVPPEETPLLAFRVGSAPSLGILASRRSLRELTSEEPKVALA